MGALKLTYNEESPLRIVHSKKCASYYRYAFNGMETDKEVSGQGNSYTTMFRQYDPRLGRWKSIDPLAGMFPDQSPYCAFDNNPIYYTDPSGLAAQHNGEDGVGDGSSEENAEKVSTVGQGKESLEKKTEAGDFTDHYFKTGGARYKATYDGKSWNIEIKRNGKYESLGSKGSYSPKSRPPGEQLKRDPKHFKGKLSPTFKKYLPTILDHEGGYVNDPDDPGGETNKGITMAAFQKSAKSILGKEPTSDNLKKLTDEEAGLIYQKIYWAPIDGDQINDEQVALQYLDTKINGGGVYVMRMSLNRMGIDADKLIQNGIILDHQGLIDAINSVDGEELFNIYKEERWNRYEKKMKENPTLEKYRNGWRNRWNTFNYEN